MWLCCDKIDFYLDLEVALMTKEKNIMATLLVYIDL